MNTKFLIAAAVLVALSNGAHAFDLADIAKRPDAKWPDGTSIEFNGTFCEPYYRGQLERLTKMYVGS